MNQKLDLLKNFIKKYDSAAIAFSGGVDSTFLAKISSELLNSKVLLVTATSSTYPFSELEEARNYAEFLKLPHRVIVSEELNIPGFSKNPVDRCYYCKSELFDLILQIARKEGYQAVFDGSNADDAHDYRPGRKASKERGILSPLLECGLTKEDIRHFSRELRLPTADKPSFACLASRFPYGEEITKEKLERVGKAEEELKRLGFTQFRIRSHENLARIECTDTEIVKALKLRKEIVKICKQSGFIYVSLDLSGYRTGAMNETLTESQKK